jgi:hypothetical protein
VPRLNAPRLTVAPLPLLPNPYGYIPQADIELHTNSLSIGTLAPLLIVPRIPGADALFEMFFPIPLDGCPIEYGCAIEYEQQINITIKTINMGLVCFMILLPSRIFL